MLEQASINAKIEPDIKEQAEQVLSGLGISVANAIDLFLYQVVLHNGLPFDVKAPAGLPLDYSKLTEEEFHAEIDKGLESLKTGRVLSSAEVKENMRKQYRA
jgi:DNA-damage-inducible protein J